MNRRQAASFLMTGARVLLVRSTASLSSQLAIGSLTVSILQLRSMTT